MDDFYYTKGFDGKVRIRPCYQGVGTFFVGDIVRWNTKGPTKIGTVIEVVPYGNYPSIRVDRGFWREHESYLIETTDMKIYWPRVCTLRLVRAKGDRSLFEQNLSAYYHHTHAILACNRARVMV